jgi:predicted metalloprotease
MDWRGRRTSNNIEDRRAGGGRTMRRGGGIGLIIVLLVGLFFGVDLSPFMGGGGMVTEEAAPAGPNAIDDEMEQFVAVVLAETEEVWGGMFEASGLDYTDPRLVLYRDGTTSGCGLAQSAMGPFYCPNDKTVYLDTDFFRVMRDQLGAGGDFAYAYVIAHEVGHHVQNELGVLGEVNQRRAQASARASNELSVRVELQADCYSGIWARSVAERLALTDDDIREALDTAARIGDDALQRASGGRVVPDSFTHGTSEQRQTWFQEGFRTGDPNACDTFGARNL